MPADRLKGSIPPLITPFRDGAVDYDTFRKLIELQIAEGSHGILVNGTTAEPSTLTTEERAALVARFETLTFGIGDVLVTEGEESEGLFLVASGDVGIPCRGSGGSAHQATCYAAGKLTLLGEARVLRLRS